MYKVSVQLYVPTYILYGYISDEFRAEDLCPKKSTRHESIYAYKNPKICSENIRLRF